MVAPWQETQFRVVVEFKKAGSGMRREISMTHRADVLPPQLHGRVSPEAWAAFVTDLSQLALNHPYLQRPSAGYWFGWLGGMISLLCIGFGCFEGDGGKYGPWLAQLEATLDRHRTAFAAGGAGLSIGHVHGSYWAQVDVDPRVMAVGAPVPTGVPIHYGEGLPSHGAGIPSQKV